MEMRVKQIINVHYCRAPQGREKKRQSTTIVLSADTGTQQTPASPRPSPLDEGNPAVKCPAAYRSKVDVQEA
ncbi:hypothetical protein E2C01_069852 [Portunus trituberculatus]|uniref:Uncharacterized protein n=1 Tax=Portunus trituberculatus TaxID=210409 RepID=A0A5B7I3W5_PORTR|nr:hypothetical protein [Portunus trituberculatus]